MASRVCEAPPVVRRKKMRGDRSSPMARGVDSTREVAAAGAGSRTVQLRVGKSEWEIWNFPTDEQRVTSCRRQGGIKVERSSNGGCVGRALAIMDGAESRKQPGLRQWQWWHWERAVVRGWG